MSLENVQEESAAEASPAALRHRVHCAGGVPKQPGTSSPSSLAAVLSSVRNACSMPQASFAPPRRHPASPWSSPP